MKNLLFLSISFLICCSPTKQKTNTEEAKTQALDSLEEEVAYIDFDEPTACQIEYYLNNESVSLEAKEFWQGKRQPSDDIATSKVLDELNSKPVEVVPFYFLVVSNIMSNTDGALTEITMSAAKKFVFETHTNEFFDFISDKDCLTSQIGFSASNWAEKLGLVISWGCESSDDYKQCINNQFKILKESCDECDVESWERRVRNWM